MIITDPTNVNETSVVDQPMGAAQYCREVVARANLDELQTVVTIISEEDADFCRELGVTRTLEAINRIRANNNPASIMVPGSEIGRDIAQVDTKYGLRDRLRQLVQEKISAGRANLS